jgi:hypothetical protein
MQERLRACSDAPLKSSGRRKVSLELANSLFPGRIACVDRCEIPGIFNRYLIALSNVLCLDNCPSIVPSIRCCGVAEILPHPASYDSLSFDLT